MSERDNSKKIDAFKYFDGSKAISEYNKIYGDDIDFSELYPANSQRLNIILSIIKKINPHSIVDAGCGNGMPMISILKEGFNITGYDKAPNMVTEAKKHLLDAGFNPNLVTHDDFENPDHIKDESCDCITGMGTFYYSKNFIETINNQRKKLVTGGSLIFSLRNSLFDLCTLNKYTEKFLCDLYDIHNKPKSFQYDFKKMIAFNDNGKTKFENIDNQNVMSIVHNPLTISTELSDLGLIVNNIYFYHYHALPPIFEQKNTTIFRKLSWELEDPNDWRGYFLASGFIVHAIKK